MKEYKVVFNAQLTVVEQEVNKFLTQGWKLAGGITMAYKHEHGAGDEHIPGHLVFAQAIEKE